MCAVIFRSAGAVQSSMRCGDFLAPDTSRATQRMAINVAIWHESVARRLTNGTLSCSDYREAVSPPLALPRSLQHLAPNPHRGHPDAVLLRAAVSVYQAVALARSAVWRGRFKTLRGNGARIESRGPRSA